MAEGEVTGGGDKVKQIGANVVCSQMEQKYFYEDEVWRLKKGHLKLGMVVETSEYSSDDDSSDEEDEQIKPGHVRVAWYPMGEEEIIPEKKLSLVDRSLMPGDVVRRFGENRQSQRGFCRKVKMYASVEVVGTQQVVYGVPTDSLIPLDKFRPDILICKDGWVGFVRDVKSMITLRFADGSKVIVEDGFASDLEDVFARRELDSRFKRYDFYPGQILFGPLNVIDSGEWVNCSEELEQARKNKPSKGYKTTVENIEVLHLTVNWLCRANFGSVKPQESDKQPAKQVLPPELHRVRMLNVFEPITVQMGDRNFYKIKESDALMTKSEWKKIQIDQLSRRKSSLTKSRRKSWTQSGIDSVKEAIKKSNKSSEADIKSAKLSEAISTSTKSSEAVSKSVKSSEAVSKPVKSSEAISKSGKLLKSDNKSARPSTPEVVKALKAYAEGKSDALSEFIDPVETDNPKARETKDKVKEDSSDYEDCEDDDKDTESNCSSKLSSGSVGDSSRRNNRRKGLSTKGCKKKKLKMSRTQKETSPMYVLAKVGMRVVAETLSTQSEVEVMWQDGRIESNLDSSELYPVQHLDDHDFFPGDFVIESKEGFHPHNYGVIQSVDYAGRCCLVKWYRTYTEGSRPEPVFLEASESSVYDLKEHPDFKFRPGAIVIRVAAGAGENCGLGAGQILDINTDGQVQVWWADEIETQTTGLCYPQDIYKVGEYDSDDGELWADDEMDDDDNSDENNENAGSSDDSWSTEYECEVGDNDDEESVKQEEELEKLEAEEVKRQQILLGFDKVQTDLLQQPCSGQPGAACCVKNLLALHAQMTHLDALMSTQFFDETNFDGLIGRLKEEEKISSVERAVQSHVTRLFSHGDGPYSPSSKSTGDQNNDGAINKSPKPTAVVDHHNNLTSTTTPDKDSGVDSFTESPPPLQTKQGKSPNQTRQENPPNQTQQENAQNQTQEERLPNQTLQENSPNQMHNKPSSLILDLSKVKASSKTIVNNDSNTTTEALAPLNTCDTLRNKLKTQLELAHDVARQKYGDQTLQDFTKIFELCENVLDNVDSELEMLNFIPCDTPVLDTSRSILSPTDTDTSFVVPLTPGSFQTGDSVPDNHKFKLTIFQPRQMKPYVKSIKKEIELLRSSLPSGITMKGFEERMDLFSAMIEGPKNTPYEDGLFFFDFQLGPDYPSVPPTCNYISYCSDKLNPNLYEDGKVCVSLLGTWNGKGTETWTPDSNLLQLLVSIQGLILVREPYYNEAGYDRQRGTREGAENSRNYNEMAVLKLVQSMTRLVKNPPVLFADEIRAYCDIHAPCMIERLERWIKISLEFGSTQSVSDLKFQLPDFPILPGSKGFCLSLQKAIKSYKDVLGIKT